MPPDPTNRFADQPGPAAFGATLFFEQRLSRDGNVSCSTCHMIDRQFQDDRPFGVAVGETRRRTMPLADVAYSPWFFWDGRRDSLWSQALVPLEHLDEHAGTRTAYAHLMARQFKDRYERIFGPLPDMAALPASAGPSGTEAERAAWNAMTQVQRDGVDDVFANIGKALASFERTITHKPTRFDRFADALTAGREPEGDAALTSDEMLRIEAVHRQGAVLNVSQWPAIHRRFFSQYRRAGGCGQAARSRPERRGRRSPGGSVQLFGPISRWG